MSNCKIVSYHRGSEKNPIIEQTFNTYTGEKSYRYLSDTEAVQILDEVERRRKSSQE